MKHLLGVRGTDSSMVPPRCLTPGRVGRADGHTWLCDTLLLPSLDGLPLSLFTLLTPSPVSLPHAMVVEQRRGGMAVPTNAFTCS